MLTFYAIIKGNYRWLNVAVFLNRPLPQLKHTLISLPRRSILNSRRVRVKAKHPYPPPRRC